jgi:biopolymer transport protein ExbB
MTTPAAGAAHGGGENPYGLWAALEQGGTIAWATFIILVIMSAASWYILFVKLFEQQKIINQGKRARTTFWQSANLREGANKLEKNSAYRQIVDDGLVAQEQHDKLTDPIDQHDWMTNSLARSQGAIASKLSTGLALLATVGSTAPFVGLFGTVIGIYRAPHQDRCGGSGVNRRSRRSGRRGSHHDCPWPRRGGAAVMGYNWLMRRNKAVLEELARFFQRSSWLHDVGRRGEAGDCAIARRCAAGAAAGGAARALRPARHRPAHHCHGQRHRHDRRRTQEALSDVIGEGINRSAGSNGRPIRTEITLWP